MKLCFIIGPYRGATLWDIHSNIYRAESFGLYAAYMGLMPVIPQANTAHFDKELTDAFWLEGTRELLSRCDCALCVPGWEKSTGSLAEIELCREQGIPFFMSASDLKEWVKSNDTH